MHPIQCTLPSACRYVGSKSLWNWKFYDEVQEDSYVLLPYLTMYIKCRSSSQPLSSGHSYVFSYLLVSSFLNLPKWKSILSSIYCGYTPEWWKYFFLPVTVQDTVAAVGSSFPFPGKSSPFNANGCSCICCHHKLSAQATPYLSSPGKLQLLCCNFSSTL